MRLRDGGSVQEHIRKLTELFEELAVIGDPVKEEHQVVNLLASLLESFNVLVGALESNADVPKIEVVTERCHAQSVCYTRNGAAICFGDKSNNNVLPTLLIRTGIKNKNNS